MHAVIFERNKLVARKVARVFMAAGATATVIEEPDAVPATLAAIAAFAPGDLLCADSFDGELVVEQTRIHPSLRGVLWTAEPLRRSLRYLVDAPAIDHVLGRRDFESAPRAWEILLVARRLAGPHTSPPFSAYLDWGFAHAELEVRTTADRDLATGRILEFVGRLQVPKRICEMVCELGHELIMNAMYDAPIDAHGRPKYAADRKADLVLTETERPKIRIGTDGTKLVLQVSDPFGRLERRHVFQGLERGLAGGELDVSHGGAGLGMTVCHNASSAMFFDVARGRHTEVTASFELDMNLREFRTQAKSLHFWSR